MDKIAPIFSNVELEAEDLSNKVYESFMSRPCSEDELIDPSDIADHAYAVA